MIVIDASATVELVAGGQRGRRVAEGLGRHVICAPQLLCVEVVAALRSLVIRGRLSAAEGSSALADFGGLDIAFYGHEALVDRIWDLRDNIGSYNAAYVALAEALRCPVLSTDARLARAPGHHAAIVVP